MAKEFTPKISFDLFDTLELNPHIQEVFFTDENQHYFNTHELDGKKYGKLIAKQVFSHSVGDKKFYKMKNVADPKALIVTAITRDEILDMIPVDEKEVFVNRRSARERFGKKPETSVITEERKKPGPKPKEAEAA